MALTSHSESGGGRYHLVEALRGLACLAVLLFHSLDAVVVTPRSVLGITRSAAEWGYLGVEVFFAISGWCIAERLAKAVARSEGAGHFIAERALRIYPTYWAVLALAIALRLAAAPFNSVGLGHTLPHSALDALSALLVLGPITGSESLLLVSWSLLYEMVFYLCAVGALLAVRRLRLSGWALFWLGVALSATGWWISLVGSPKGNFGVQFLTMWPNFFVGVAAWWAARRQRSGEWFLFVGLLAVETLVGPRSAGAPQYVALGMSAILLVGWKFDPALAALPGMETLRWVGAFSYSLYLIHAPILSPIENAAARLILGSSPAFIAIWLGALAAAIAAGWAVNRFIELPLERWRRRRF